MTDIADGASGFALEVLAEADLGSPIGQCRAVPVALGSGARGFLTAWCADFDVDPYVEMFFFPTDTLKLALIDESGEVYWRRDLGPGVVPGVWFCPVLAFDLDGDGVDEVWFVDNVNTDHPLSHAGARLARLDALSGEETGGWPWPYHRRGEDLSHAFRNFLAAGHVRGEPVLVTAQGTYGAMTLQGWRASMTPRWEALIPADAPGARGSHMCAVVDVNGDGVDELMWGERAISLDDGAELFCCDRDAYRGHSDVVQPMLDRDTGRWFLYTCREGDADARPRVVLFDDRGRRVWGRVDQGHIDMGWVARIGEGRRHVAMATRIGVKTCGPDGRHHEGMQEYTFDALTGAERPLGFSTYRTIPVDLNGDGYHELVRGRAGGDGEVLDRHGHTIGRLGGAVAMAGKLVDHPGEQMLSYHADGKVRLWADRNAQDAPEALRRYEHPFYAANRRLTGTGYNLGNLGGI